MSCGAVTSIDFKKDCAEILRERLKAAGYVVDSDVVLEQVLIKYFNVLKRRIASQPRTVITSKEFACPEEFKAGLSLIVKKAANGEDLTPHQSRLLMDSNYIDLLLNDWGIHHFHLGTAVKQSGLIGRTGLLLFARVTAAQFYLLDVLAHQNWTRLRLIEIMHTNWPDSIRVNKIPAAIGLEHRAADDDIQL